jgi:hypothetical protein
MIASLGSVWLPKTKVCDCKICWFISVTAKKENEKLNQCVIATIWRAWLQTRSYVCCKNTWHCLCACKATWLFRIWLQAWVVCHCKKLKCVIAQPVFLWIQYSLCACICRKKCIKHKLLKMSLWLFATSCYMWLHCDMSAVAIKMEWWNRNSKFWCAGRGCQGMQIAVWWAA